MKKEWQSTVDYLKRRVNPHIFSTWLLNMKPVEIKRDYIFILVPNLQIKEWIEKNYGELLKEAVTKSFGKNLAPIIMESKKDYPLDEYQPPSMQSLPFHEIDPELRFDTFVVGPCNDFANAACKAVAQNPSRSYNPLFLHGGVGLGKTHLLNAIGNEIISNSTSFRIIYTTASTFMNEMIGAIGKNRQSSFREKYRNVDILLIDDVHILTGKEATQEELFHTFNSLYESHRQLVIAADKPPKDLGGIEDRLISRFKWGLTVGLEPPDFEMRMAIINKKAAILQIELPDDVAITIANRAKSNIREIEGGIQRLKAYSSFKGKPINMELAKEAFMDFFSDEARPLNCEIITKEVASFYHLKPSELKSKTNKSNIVLPRQVAMFLCKELLKTSFPEIGRHFGGKHHSTVIHAYNKIKELFEKDTEFHTTINNIKQILQ